MHYPKLFNHFSTNSVRFVTYTGSAFPYSYLFRFLFKSFNFALSQIADNYNIPVTDIYSLIYLFSVIISIYVSVDSTEYWNSYCIK